MTAATHDFLREYAGKRWPSMNHKGRMAQLARHLGFGHRRVRSLYQNEPGVSLRAMEAERIEALRKETNAIADRAFAARIAALEEELAALRAEIASGSVASSGELASRQGRQGHGSRAGSPRRGAED